MDHRLFFPRLRAERRHNRALCEAAQTTWPLTPPGSGWGPREHLEHLALASGLCLDAVETLLANSSGRILRSGGPTRTGRVILLLGRIPRGTAKAPASTVPETPDPEGLEERLSALHHRWRGLLERRAEIAAAPGRLPHPMLGAFSAAQWMRFVVVHDLHHLDLARDLNPHGA